MKKKSILSALCLAFAGTILSGCGGNTQGGSQGNATTSDSLKIAIVSSPNGVDDGSFNQENYEGIKRFTEAHPGSSVTPVQEKTGDTAAAVKAVEDIVVDYDAIVCDGFQFAAISEVASDNPDKTQPRPSSWRWPRLSPGSPSFQPPLRPWPWRRRPW